MTSTTTRREWWMSLDLVVLPNALLLIGMTSARRLASAVLRAGTWSAVTDTPVAFSALRRPVCILRGRDRLDLFSVDGTGTFAFMTLSA